MSVTIPRKYRQAFIETTIGVFAVSVLEDVELDARGFILNPRMVFEPESIVVLIEKQDMPPGTYTIVPPPWEPARDEPKTVTYGKQRFGTYMIAGFLEDGRPEVSGPDLDKFLWPVT
jgi:hypothetical protein